MKSPPPIQSGAPTMWVPLCRCTKTVGHLFIHLSADYQCIVTITRPLLIFFHTVSARGGSFIIHPSKPAAQAHCPALFTLSYNFHSSAEALLFYCPVLIYKLSMKSNETNVHHIIA